MVVESISGKYCILKLEHNNFLGKTRVTIRYNDQSLIPATNQINMILSFLESLYSPMDQFSDANIPGGLHMIAYLMIQLWMGKGIFLIYATPARINFS